MRLERKVILQNKKNKSKELSQNSKQVKTDSFI